LVEREGGNNSGGVLCPIQIKSNPLGFEVEQCSNLAGQVAGVQKLLLQHTDGTESLK
jgi:hypothetical protein